MSKPAYPEQHLFFLQTRNFICVQRISHIERAYCKAGLSLTTMGKAVEVMVKLKVPPYFCSFRSISPSSSATPSTGWSCWPRRSRSWATPASTSTPRCCRPTGTASSTTSETATAATWCPQVPALPQRAFRILHRGCVPYGCFQSHASRAL